MRASSPSSTLAVDKEDGIALNDLMIFIIKEKHKINQEIDQLHFVKIVCTALSR